MFSVVEWDDIIHGKEERKYAIEEMIEERRTNNPSFLVDVAGHLHNLAKELRGKVKLTIEMYDNI